MLPEHQQRTYDAFFKSTAENDILDPKTTTLIQLATSFALGCYPCMDHFLGVAREKGLTDEQIGAVQSIVMAISAGQIRAQFREVRENTAE
ncbi:MAG: carboxymuconolactone decarboxylase family protein [Thermodesulfobacteriota bacterium]